MTGKITIKNKTQNVAVIDIEGVIGVPEHWQFEQPGERVATYETFRAIIEQLKQLDANEIVVNIRSTGGNVNDALLIHDTLKELDAKITTKCFGYVASAATIIAQAASEGSREVSSNSLYLIHKSVCATEGNVEEMSRSMGLLDKTDQRIATIYAERADKPVEVFSQLMAENDGNGKWLSPEEVVEYGLADIIIGSEPITSNAVRAIANLGLPPIPKQKRDLISNITKQWNAILEVLGVVENDSENVEKAEKESGKEHKIEETPEVNAEELKIDDLIKAQSEISQIHKTEVRKLQNKIATLEAQNARLAVGATQTQPKEDPAAHEELRTPNENAYMQDLMGFRS